MPVKKQKFKIWWDDKEKIVRLKIEIGVLFVDKKMADEIYEGALSFFSSRKEKTLIIVDGNIYNAVSDENGNWVFSVPSSLALEDGEYLLELKAIDLAGNESGDAELNLNIIIPVGVIISELITEITIPEIVEGEVLPMIPELIEAVEVTSLPSPKIIKVEPILEGNTFSFTGVSIPNQEVVVYINSEKTLVYRTIADSSGMWRINHSQDIVELKPGEHSIFAVSVDRESKVKSPLGIVKLFNVQKSIWVTMYNYLNLQTTIISIIVLLAAILFLYRIKQKEPVQL